MLNIRCLTVVQQLFDGRATAVTRPSNSCIKSIEHLTGIDKHNKRYRR